MVPGGGIAAGTWLRSIAAPEGGFVNITAIRRIEGIQGKREQIHVVGEVRVRGKPLATRVDIARGCAPSMVISVGKAQSLGTASPANRMHRLAPTVWLALQGINCGTDGCTSSL